MLATYHKFLKDNNKKIFLKYDGLRDKFPYTVRIFERNEDKLNDSYGGDTTNIKDMLTTALREANCLSDNEISTTILSQFTDIENIAKNKYGKKIICILSCEYIDNNISYLLYLSKDTQFLEIKNTDFDDIITNLKLKQLK